LPDVVRSVPQERVSAYADAADDHNPVHLDAEFAAKSQFGRRIAHGMLTLAFIVEMMAKAFPDDWQRGGRIKARFKAPVYCGDSVTAFGEVTAVTESPSGCIAECRVGLRRSSGEEAISGQAWVTVRAA
jgi:3-hydroxybutyryl-CoA dehydratase